MAHAIARSRIWIASSSRRSGSSTFESLQAANLSRRIEDHRRGEHRSGERSATGFVDAGDQHATPACASSAATASAASAPVSAFNTLRESGEQRLEPTPRDGVVEQVQRRLREVARVASLCRNSGTTNRPASTLGSPT